MNHAQSRSRSLLQVLPRVSLSVPRNVQHSFVRLASGLQALKEPGATRVGSRAGLDSTASAS